MKVKYITIKVCANCERELTLLQITQSKGVCEYCGSNSNSTILNIKKVIFKKTRLHKYWQFWKSIYKYQTNDKFSNEWLKNNL